MTFITPAPGLTRGLCQHLMPREAPDHVRGGQRAP